MPSAEIPKFIFDDLIHWQIKVGRYTNGQTRDILRLLLASEREIEVAIVKAGRTSFTARRLRALLAEIRTINRAVYSSARDQLAREMMAFAARAAEQATGVLSDQLPVKWSPVGLSDTQLAAIVNTTPISISGSSKLLVSEIFAKVAAGRESAIIGAVRLGMSQGESVHQIVNRMPWDVSRREMTNLVHSVVQHTNNEACAATLAVNSEVLNGWIYVATLDSRTCPLCWSQSGKQFPLGEGPIPIRHIKCRCFQAPAVKTWRELGLDIDEFPPAMRASANGPVRADISFDEWLRGQPAGVQKDLLGPTRQKLFAEGGLKLDKFTDDSGRLLRLDQL